MGNGSGRGLILDRAQLCEALGVSDSAVSAWEKKGCPAVRKGRGRGMRSLYDLYAVRAWCAQTGYGHSIQALMARFSRTEPATAPLPVQMSAPPAGDQETAATSSDRSRDEELRGELLESKLRQQRADTELRELELAERRGELVSVEELSRVSARRYRAIRDQVLGIPDRLAWLSREDRLKLAAELKRVLHELAADARAEAARIDQVQGREE